MHSLSEHLRIYQVELLFHQHMICSLAKRKWGSSRCVWAGVGLELQRRTQGKLEGGSFEWEGRGWGDGGTYGRDGRKVSLWEQETRLADARWPSQPREMDAACEPHFRMGKGD